jgi:hypothetical protein
MDNGCWYCFESLFCVCHIVRRSTSLSLFSSSFREISFVFPTRRSDSWSSSSSTTSHVFSLRPILRRNKNSKQSISLQQPKKQNIKKWFSLFIKSCKLRSDTPKNCILQGHTKLAKKRDHRNRKTRRKKGAKSTKLFFLEKGETQRSTHAHTHTHDLTVSPTVL